MAPRFCDELTKFLKYVWGPDKIDRFNKLSEDEKVRLIRDMSEDERINLIKESVTLLMTPDDKAFLTRWIKDDRTEGVWSKITKIAPRMARFPQLLIARFVTIRRRAFYEERLLNDERGRAEFAAGLRKRLIYEMRSDISNTALADHLERAASFLRTPSPPPPADLGPTRQDRNGSRRRLFFMRQTSEELRQITGRWLDDETATLTEIAFPGTEITDEQVRSARRGRRPR
jgi:hypothetical protein